MNREQLQKALHAERIDPRSYSLLAETFDPDEALCLRKEGDGWLVFYSERGLKTGAVSFSSESDACAHLLETLRADPTIKIGWSSGFGASGGA